MPSFKGDTTRTEDLEEAMVANAGQKKKEFSLEMEPSGCILDVAEDLGMRHSLLG